MAARRLLLSLTIYYAVIAILVMVAIQLFPHARDWLPIGGVQQLVAQPGKATALKVAQVAQSVHSGTMGQSLFWLTVAILGALLAALPVSWTYMAVRSGAEYDQSLVSTIVILPMVVTGIVIIVQNSLALAFSLAGIAGAVRFRNSLKSSGDALFILMAVGIGLSAGIGAVELAALASVMFNYTFAALWLTEYGERRGMKRYLADVDGIDEAAPPVIEKK
jgi:hypothetical protein